MFYCCVLKTWNIVLVTVPQSCWQKDKENSILAYFVQHRSGLTCLQILVRLQSQKNQH